MSKFLLILFALFSFTALSNSNFSINKVKLELPNGWQLGEVAGVVQRKNGNSIVFNRGEHQLLEFSPAGKFIQEIGTGSFSKPHGLRIDKQGNIWTTDDQNHLVLRFGPSGEVSMVLGMKNKPSAGWFDRDYNLVLFKNPQDVGFDSAGNIYVVDKGNARIVKLDANGLLIKTWGTKGSKPGEFNFAHSIVIDNDDRIYIADRENKRIQLFTHEGDFIEQWTNVGYPYVLTLVNDSLWTTDARAEKVRQFDLTGKLLTSYQGERGRNSHQFGFVHGIHITPQGDVLLSQVLNWSVLKLTPDAK